MLFHVCVAGFFVKHTVHVNLVLIMSNSAWSQ